MKIHVFGPEEPRTATITSESFAECLKIQRQAL